MNERPTRTPEQRAAERQEKRRQAEIDRQTERARWLNTTELKERGWTEAGIKRFLGAEDRRVENPCHNSGPGIRHYLKTRVLAAEASVEYKEWTTNSAHQKAAGAKANQTKIHNMVERIETATITIVRGKTDEEIRTLAVATHGGNYEGKPGEFHWSNRTARNCIRHCLTNYESLWTLINRGETGQEAYEILRERVDELIDEAYPQFMDDEP